MQIVVRTAAALTAAHLAGTRRGLVSHIATALVTTPVTVNSCVDRNVAQLAAAGRVNAMNGAEAANAPDNVIFGTMRVMNLVATVLKPVKGTTVCSIATKLADGPPMTRSLGRAACRLSCGLVARTDAGSLRLAPTPAGHWNGGIAPPT